MLLIDAITVLELAMTAPAQFRVGLLRFTQRAPFG